MICVFIYPSSTVRKTASNLELDITGCTYTAILISYVTLKNFTHKGYFKQLATKNKVHRPVSKSRKFKTNLGSTYRTEFERTWRNYINSTVRQK